MNDENECDTMKVKRKGRTKRPLSDVRITMVYLTCIALCIILTSSTLTLVLSSDAESDEEITGLVESPWPKFRGNARNTGRSPYDTSHVDGTEIWNYETDEGVGSSPAIGIDGTIYVGSNDNDVYAINPDGSEKWSFTTGGSVFSSPAVGVDGTIYIGSYDHNFYAINPDGSEKWRFATEYIILSSPAIGPDGTIYIGEIYSWSLTESFYALNPDGSEKWSRRLDFTTSPIIGANQTIYVCSYTHLLSLNSTDGSTRWLFRLTWEDRVFSSPALGADGTIYIGSSDNNVYAINPDGTEKWNFTTGDDVRSSPAIGADGTIYVGSFDNNVYAINPDGTERWNFTTEDHVFSSPAIGADGTIYVGSGDNNIYALNPDGSEKWRFTTGGGVSSSSAIGEDGTIYVGSSDGKLYAISRTAPLISDETPSDDATDVPVTTPLSVYVEAITYPAEVEFYLDDELVHSETLDSDGVVETNILTLDYNTTYHWEVVVEDEKGMITNETYSFTTVAPQILTIHPEEGGTTVPAPGTYNHTYGDTITIEAIPDEGWRFSHWEGDYEGTEEEITITMDGHKSITAHFERHEHRLTINIQGDGSTVPGEGVRTYEHGDNVTVDAIPAEGWIFVGWTGDVPENESDELSITIVMDGDKNITAHFDEILYPSIEIISPEYDRVFDSGDVTVEWRGEEGTYPISHYEIRLNDGDWVNIGTATAHTFTVTERGDHVVSVRVFDAEGNSDVDSIRFAIEESSPGSYWWLILLLIIVVVVIILVMNRGKGEESFDEEDTSEIEENTIEDDKV